MFFAFLAGCLGAALPRMAGDVRVTLGYAGVGWRKGTRMRPGLRVGCNARRTPWNYGASLTYQEDQS